MPTLTETLANPAIELRAIKPLASGGNDVFVGYYNDPAILATHAKRLNDAGYHIYSPINLILQTETVLARLNQPPARGDATCDEDIARRLALPYDFDAVRAIDDKATATARALAATKAAEKMTAAKAAVEAALPGTPEATKAAKALAAAEKVTTELTSKPKTVRHKAATEEERRLVMGAAKSTVVFWRTLGVEPVVLDSGNGIQVKVPIDLPNDAASKKLIGEVLAIHKAEFEAPGVTLDCWDDAARIFRLPGYFNVKGDNSDPLRPHRLVKQFKLMTGEKAFATREMLDEIVRKKNTSKPADKPAAEKTDNRGRFNLENVETMLSGISEREPNFRFEAGKTTSYGSGFYVSCPNADEHSAPDGAIVGDDLSSTAAVWVNQRGWANFRCQHSHCQDLGWREFVELTKSADLQNVITKPWLAYGIHGSGVCMEGEQGRTSRGRPVLF